jgi:hypothetical protein
MNLRHHAVIGLGLILTVCTLAGASAAALTFQNGVEMGILKLNANFSPQAWEGVGALNAGWQAKAFADVNGDGNTDIIFQDGSQLGLLLLKANGQPTAWVGLGSMQEGWELRAAADINRDGRPELIFQNGQELGFLTLNSSLVPVAWSGIGEMALGWELCCAKDVNGDGGPDLLFQNGALLGALQVGTNGLPTAWHGMGAMGAGWNLIDSVDIDGDGRPELMFQNGTTLGALQVNTSFLPTAWHGIGALGAGWVSPEVGTNASIVVGSGSGISAIGQFFLDSSLNYSLWQEVQRDGGGNITATTGIAASSVPDGVWAELLYDTSTGLPSTMIFSSGVILSFTAFDSVNKTATADVVVDGATAATGVVLQLDGLLVAQSGIATASIKAAAMRTSGESSTPPIVTYSGDLMVMFHASGELVEKGIPALNAAKISSLSFGTGVLVDVAVDFGARQAKGTSFELAADTIKFGVSLNSCLETAAVASAFAPASFGLSYIPAVITCSGTIASGITLYNAVQNMSDAQIQAEDSTLTQAAYSDVSTPPTDAPTVTAGQYNDVYTLPPPDFDSYVTNMTQRCQPLLELQAMDPNLPNETNGLKSYLDGLIGGETSTMTQQISFIQQYDPTAAYLIPELQADANACIALQASTDVALTPAP